MATTKREGGVGVLDRQREELREPPKYSVIFHNDDFTPMDFVTALLVQVFHHPHARAVKIMLDVHENGKGVAGIYTREIAETKTQICLAHAKQHEHPFEVSIEPEE